MAVRLRCPGCERRPGHLARCTPSGAPPAHRGGDPIVDAAAAPSAGILIALVLAATLTRSLCATVRIDHGWEVNQGQAIAVARTAHHRHQPVNECDAAGVS